ncbi:thiol:disulfide interchange protein DsbD [Arenicella chitinivorans]|uniref:Thiol:disulfide interchange protein DsbD n=1 Tax=Arenicella chitinivorans TaxID=1329800 RepID=A0A918RQJ0_9GAMM|nr:thiol:disulfide interchange protein DsbD [Arenicella chitinivorans]
MATDNVVASLVSEQAVVVPGSRFSVALQLDIRDGWHTYWRNPGDSGQATAIAWTLPDSVSAGEIQWPFPERQYVGPVANYGYHGTAMHLVDMQLAADWPIGEPVVLAAEANWLVCEEECIPERASLRFEIPTGAQANIDPNQTAKFEQTRATLPRTLAIESAYQYAETGDQLRFEFSPAQELIQAESLAYFPFEWGFVSAPAEQQVVIDSEFVSITTQKGDLRFSTPMGGVLVINDPDGGQRAYEVVSSPGPLGASPPVTPLVGETSSLSLGVALLLALAGGVILNLMPCVFPVLFIKALSLMSHANDSAQHARQHGLAYTVGVLASFVVLGVLLITLKAAGEQIGWGFQLQSPLFVSLVALVLFVLALSLSGFVEIGTRLMGLGSNLANQAGYRGSFFTGVLAVVVATPCTAPFMGPAVGFAVTQPAPVTIAVLLALGLGLALPYLVLSWVPAWTRWLPKPGVWMQRVQQFLAFPMYATAVWLVWVLGQQVGINGVLALLMVFVLTALTIWLWQVSSGEWNAWRMLGRFAAVLIIGGIVFLFTLLVQGDAGQATQNMGADESELSKEYVVFDAEQLSQLQAQGTPVFVNMTAAWCITCLANEKVALSSAELRDYFTEHGIVYMKGDWTNQDAAITEYLASFGRNSVPLYVYYPPGDGAARVLPQLLTVATVIEYIERQKVATEPPVL